MARESKNEIIGRRSGRRNTGDDRETVGEAAGENGAKMNLWRGFIPVVFFSNG